MDTSDAPTEDVVPDDRSGHEAQGDPPAQHPRLQRFTGAAADGLVTVTVSETGALLGVHVYPGEYRREDPPGLANMGDMVVDALRAAKERAAGGRESRETSQDRA